MRSSESEEQEDDENSDVEHDGYEEDEDDDFLDGEPADYDNDFTSGDVDCDVVVASEVMLLQVVVVVATLIWPRVLCQLKIFNEVKTDRWFYYGPGKL